MIDKKILTYPGEILKSIRKKNNISIIEVAKKLKLKPSLIYDLENNINIKKIPQVFLIGYFRNYSKYLNCDISKNIFMFKNYLESKYHSKKIKNKDISYLKKICNIISKIKKKVLFNIKKIYLFSIILIVLFYICNLLLYTFNNSKIIIEENNKIIPNIKIDKNISNLD